MKKFYVLSICMLFAVFSLLGQSRLVVQVSTAEDDQEEVLPGSTNTEGNQDVGSSDLELGSESTDGSEPQLVGIRFRNVDIPRGAIILGARILFTVDEPDKKADPAVYTIRAQDDDNPGAFSPDPFNITSRPTLAEMVSWNVAAGTWTAAGESGPDQTTSDISSLVQALVNRDGWSAGNAMVFTIEGSGTRTAESFDGSPSEAAKLEIDYIVPQGISVQVAQASDSQEEVLPGSTQTVGNQDIGSSDLELGSESTDGSRPQLVGVRFDGLNIPQGAVIVSANIQFTIDEPDKNADPASYTIKAQDDANPGTFTADPFNISSRPTLSETVTWDVPAGSWTDGAGIAGPDQRSSDISALVQALVNKADWTPGNAMAFTIEGTGTRTAESFAGSPSEAPVLNVQFIGTRELRKRVAQASDDLEEALAGNSRGEGNMDVGSSDLELGSENTDGSRPQMIGIRFADLDLPKGAQIQHAYIQFTIDEPDKNADPTMITIRAQDADNPTTFTDGAFNISSRTTLGGSISWDIPAGSWTDGAGVAGPDQRTPDISSLVQELVNRDGWTPGNAMVFTFEGTGTRTAESFDGSPAEAAELVITLLATEPGLPAARFPIAQRQPWSYAEEMPSGDWTSLEFDDTEWPIGNGVLGFGADNLGTELSGGNNTVYFRKRVTIESMDDLAGTLAFSMLAEDGAEVYINGTLVNSFASTEEGKAESTYFLYQLDKGLFVEGDNIIAVKVTATDNLLFDASLDNLDLNTRNSGIECEEDDLHISCFNSLLPVSQDDFIGVPSTHRFQYIAREGDPYMGSEGVYGNNFDFTGYVPINGSSAHGYLSINYETTPGGVSITEIQLNKSTGLWEVLNARPVDFSGVGGGTVRNCSGTVTPWGTIITCEEDYGGNMDTDGDGYLDIGWCIEIDPATASIREYGTGAPQKLWALGRMSHENVVIADDRRTVYFGEDTGDGSVYKFVADNPEDLTSGTLYVLILDGEIDGDFEPTTATGTWVEVPNSTQQERNDVKDYAKNTLGATQFSGVEDVEISPADGMIYFAVKGNAGKVYRLRDEGATFSGFETFVGGQEYVINVDGRRVVADWFSGQDNLTFDDKGNLYVLQDGGNNYIWLVGAHHTQNNPAVEIFFHTPNGAEPTGMTFTPDFRYMFMSVQHPSASTPQGDVAGVSVVHDKEVAIVIAREEFLGVEQKGFAFAPSMLNGLNGFEAKNIFTVGETIGDYLPAGIPDGIGAVELDDNTVRLFVNHELTAGSGYAYELANGLSLTGARVSYFDVDKSSMAVVDAGLAYDKVFDRAYNEVTDAGQINEGDSDSDGFDRFCSATLFEAGTFNLEDDIFFTGEETDGGIEYALDIATGEIHAVPWMGRAAWESVTMLDPGNPNQVAILVGDDRAPAPLLLYIGEKNAVGDGSFLDRNGLKQGALYVWAATSGSTTPAGFSGTGTTAAGQFVEIDIYDEASAGTDGYDALGFVTQAKQDELATTAGAFFFSRPEDVATNPSNPTQAVMASTGRGQLYPEDNWGTLYIIDVNFANLSATLDIVYDGDDAGAGQFEGPDFGLRSPDNLDWADNGNIYVQEDRSTSPGSLFGGASGEEASIWEVNPVSGRLVRVGQVDRAAVPDGQTDPSPNDIGNWETSGILDVSDLFDMPEGERLFILDVQAHSLRDGIIADEDLVQGGQLVFLQGEDRPFTKAPAQIIGLNGFNTKPLFTVGESINGYTPTGIFDGMGATKMENGKVRFFVNSELTSTAGYPYELANGARIPGARIHYFDVDPATMTLLDGGLAYDRIVNRDGSDVTDASELEFGSLNRFCSGALFEAGEFGLVNTIMFSGEETSNGTEYLLDVENNVLYAAPWLGRAAWESITLIESGDPNKVALIVGDDRGGAPLLLYIGEKGGAGTGDFLDNNGFAQGKLYVWSANNASSPEDWNGTGGMMMGSFVEIEHYDPAMAGMEGYDELGFADQSTQDALAAAAGAFEFSRPEDVATNPNNPNHFVMASTGRGQAYPSDNWGTTYIFDVDIANLTAKATIIYDGDDAGAGQFESPDFGMRSPDNLEWAGDGKIYLQEDRSTSPGSLFGGESGEEASIWALNPVSGTLARVGQVDRSAVPNGQTDPSPTDIGNWETSGIIDVSDLFEVADDEMLFFVNVQAHSLRDGVIADEDLVQGGQLLFMSGPKEFLTSSKAMVSGLNDWEAQPLFTVGESINGYTPTGIFDGIGATQMENGNVRFFVTSELTANAGYPYELSNGAQIPGARIHYFDVDPNTYTVVDGGLAYDRIVNRDGSDVTDASELEFGGLNRFCSAALFEAGEYGLENTIFFAGEETGGGTEYLLDVENNILYAAPWLGKAGWENVTLLETGDDNTIAVLVGDDRQGAPMLLYVGQKGAKGDGSFLDNNGFAQGKLYVWVANNAISPEDFNGTNQVMNGSFVEINYYDPSQAGTNGYDALGFADQATQDALAAAAGAFQFSRPEDVATNPADGTQAVMASTGRGQAYPSDNWGTMYFIDVDFSDLTAKVKILYDGDDAGAGQFEGPDFGLRSPDNLDWAANGKIYIQEDRSTSPGSLFGGTSGEEASIWEMNPVNGELIRIGQVDRTAVPPGQTDPSPNDIGNWETSGILDVSDLFGAEGDERIFILDAQAHSLRDGVIADENLVQGGQLLFLKGSSAAVKYNGQVTFRLIHNNDGESKLEPQDVGGELIGGAAEFLTVVKQLREAQINDITLSSGDNFLAGIAFNASLNRGDDKPYYDAEVLDAIGYDAITIGNHDFDFGPDVLEKMITDQTSGTPYLSANLDFSAEPGLQALVDAGRIAKSTIIDMNGEQVGVIGLIYENVPTVTSLRNVTVIRGLAAILQEQVDALEAAGVNKIILSSHLQSINEEIELISMVNGVDVVIAGGGDELLTNNPDNAIPGISIFDQYPVKATDASGDTVFVVTTPGEYRYVGNLIVEFNDEGVVTGIGEESDVILVKGFAPDEELKANVVDSVAAYAESLDQNIVARTEVDLDGTREGVRTMETNQGNLIADAFLWLGNELAATQGLDPNIPIVAVQNGGGIRNNEIIPANSDISEKKTFDILPFDNNMVVMDPISPDSLKAAMENSVSNIENVDGRFLQIAGFKIVYDPNGTPDVNRILSITLDDNTKIVENGQVVGGAPDVYIITNNFTAAGGDDYPEFAALNATLLGFSYQRALYEYLLNGPINGVVTATDYPVGGEGRITTGMLPYQPKMIPESNKQFDLFYLGTFETGVFDEGASEIVAYDAVSRRLFSVNANANTVSIISIVNPFKPVLVDSIDMSAYGDGVNSVDVYDGLVAIASQAEAADANGKIVFFDTLGNYISDVTVGVLPDMLTFTPDGTKVLVANEGEPNADYTLDPEGSVSIINVANGAENAQVVNINFNQFDGLEDALRAQGIRIFGPGASASQDFEPEYIAVTEDGLTAFAFLQENNAAIIIDINTAGILGIVPLGYKDHSLPGNGFDASNRSSNIDIRNWPTLGMYQPDAAKSINIDGVDYIVTANEGDARDYDGYSEEERVSGLILDPTAYPNAAQLQNDTLLGRLNSTLATGDTDGDGDVDQIFSYGARSFSIWSASTGELIFDSGDHFEQKTAELLPDDFNSNNDENDSRKSRSDDKGPEPEAVELVRYEGSVFALIGLERIGGVMVYDITDPTAPEFVNYVNNRDFSVEDATSSAIGDLGVEDIIFIPLEQSPVNAALVVTSNEVSGTVSVFSVNTIPDEPVSSDDLNLAAYDFKVGPVPFGANTVLTYKLPQSSDVNIALMDLMGRSLQTITSGRQVAGEHTFTIDGQKLPQGVYNIFVTIDGQANSIKVIKQ